MAEFLTGPCSCEVKEMNPGYDLLLAANWNSLAGYQEVMLPESAAADRHVAVRRRGRDQPRRAANAKAAPGVAGRPRTPTAPVARDHLVRNLVVVLGIGLVFLAATTLVLKDESRPEAPMI